MITATIFLRADQVSKDGLNTLCVRIINNCTKKDISLKIYIPIEHWDDKKLVIKKSYPNHFKINLLIEKYKIKIDSYFYNLRLNDKNFSFEDFKNFLFNVNGSSISFFEFVESEIKKRQTNKETLRTYLTQLTKLKKFMPKLVFRDLNKDVVFAYKTFMIRVLKNNENTYNKSLSMLRTFVNWSIEAGLIKDNPFSSVQISRIQGKREHLNEYELEILENLFHSGNLASYEKNALRTFLFSCYTGLRYRDMRNLKFKDIKQRLMKDEYIDFIDIKTHKTDEYISIPLIDKAKNLLDENRQPNFPVFKTYTNQVTNRYLKDIMEKANIDKVMSFHCSRHTFATIGLSLGVDITVIQKLLGHTNIRTTMIYAKVTNEKKFREIQKMQ